MTNTLTNASSCYIQDTSPEELADCGVCGYRNYVKQDPLQMKIKWYQQEYENGLRVKSLFTSENKSQGMIEYVPGRFAWRPVAADDYMFIHCLFVGYKKQFKGKGYATDLIHACMEDAKNSQMKGVAVVSRKTSFMAGKEIFLKNGFTVVDTSAPDFELLVYKFDINAADPYFLNNKNTLANYQHGLYILRADQCPYSLKNVEEIISVAAGYGLNAEVVNLKNHLDAQKSPNAFGTFCIILDGEIISYHPISSTRFRNIIKQKTK